MPGQARLDALGVLHHAARVAEKLGIRQEDVYIKGRYRRVVEARSLFCYWAVWEFGISMSALSQKLGISIPSISVSVSRGRMIAEKNGYRLIS